jgi:hypothetical protein
MWVILALACALALPGCLAPFRVHVDPEIVAKSNQEWAITPTGISGNFPGTRTREMRYTYDGNGANPPFPGTLQVFSLRGLDRLTTAELLEHAKRVVDTGAERLSISLNATVTEGTRVLESGIETRWFVRTGQTTEASPLFDENVRMRILGEVGHDGRSNTSFLVVAYAQVGRAAECGPILPSCTPAQNSDITWIQLVGDREGSVMGATSSIGFVDHLVTR